MQFYGGSSGGSGGGPDLTGTSPTSSSSGAFGQGGAGPAPDLGKTSIDFTNPGSIIGALGSIGGMVGGLGIPGVATVGGVVGAGVTLGQNVAGGIGDIGVGGFGVKQAVGVAGDIASAPGKYIHTEVAKSRASQYSTGHGVGGIGDIIAGSLGVGQNAEANALPADLQYKLDGGASVDEVAAELVKRNAGFEKDPLWNTLDSIALDPMNLIFGGIGKVGTIGKSASQAAAMGKELGAPEAFMAGLYRAATVGLPKAAEVGIVHALGPATVGLQRAIPEALPLAARLGTYGETYGTRANELLGIANAQHLAAATADLSFTEGSKTMLAMDRGTLTATMEAGYKNQQILSKSEIERKVADMLTSTVPHPVSVDPAQIAEETAQMISTATGAPLEIAQKAVRGTKLKDAVAEWQAAYTMRYGAAVEDAVGLKALGKTATIDATKATLIAPGSIWQQRAQTWVDGLKAAVAGEKPAAQRITDAAAKFNVEHPATGDLNQLDEAMGAAKTAAPVAATGSVEEIMKEVLTTNADVAGQIAKDAKTTIGKLTPEHVIKYLTDHMETFPRALEEPTMGEKAKALPELFQNFKAKWGPLGYQIGMEPENLNLTRVVDGETQLVRPWVPLASGSVSVVQRNPLGKVYEGLFGGIRQGRIISEATTRLAGSLAQRGISTVESKAIMRGVYSQANIANKLGLASTPRAVWHHYDEIFRSVLGDLRVTQLERDGFNPVFEMNRALEGNLGTVGLTQKITGVAKTKLTGVNNVGVEIAEGIYPNLKFKLNPLFWAQEVIESPFWNTLRGINPFNTGHISPEVRDLYETMTKHDIARNVFEAGQLTEVAGAIAATKAFGEGSKLGNALRGTVDAALPRLRQGGLGGFKSEQVLIQTVAKFPDLAKEAMLEVSPASWAAWEEKINPLTNVAYGSDTRAIVQGLVQERINMAAGQKGLNYELDAIEKAGLLPTVEQQTAWQAVTYALRKSSDEAYKTHFFNPERGALERTLNHPYLGLYPLSYMWGKVVPEFARFLFLKPFGRDMPFVGYSAATKVQQALLVQMQDPQFAQAVKKNAGMIYLIQLLLPATPTNIPVNSPALARHLANANAAGKSYNPTNEINSGIQHIGVMNLPSTLSSAVGGDIGGVVNGLTGAAGITKGWEQNALSSIQDTLDNAAQTYDGNFGR